MTVDQILNSKHEVRNKFQTRMLKRSIGHVSSIGQFEFIACFGFRVSCFGFDAAGEFTFSRTLELMRSRLLAAPAAPTDSIALNDVTIPAFGVVIATVK